MRSDYALYIVAIIFFILTSVVLAYEIEFRTLWIVTTAILGLLFIGLGYSQRPRPQSVAPMVAIPTPTPPPTQLSTAPPQPVVTEVAEEKTEPIVETLPQAPTATLTDVKGIKAKRAEQLKALGVNGLEDLAAASAKDLAVQLKISPKITGKWIEHAKQLVEKS